MILTLAKTVFDNLAIETPVGGNQLVKKFQIIANPIAAIVAICHRDGCWVDLLSVLIMINSHINI